MPADAADVVTVVRFAAERGVEVVPQRTGHNAAPLGDLSGTILLRTDAMTDVHLDGERRLALVGAGAKWADVVPAASDLGLVALHGSTPDVSVAGYTLGGGIGWYARAHGLAAHSLTGVERVTFCNSGTEAVMTAVRRTVRMPCKVRAFASAGRIPGVTMTTWAPGVCGSASRPS